MDKLFVNDLSFYGFHGALPEENILGQPYVTSLIFELDTRRAGETDRLEETVDYRQAIEAVREVVTGQPCKLIETVAHRIAQRILAEMPLVQAVTVRLTKPRPPVAASFNGVTIEIRREREPSS
jgi:7,8-dihydroneopterin aldolase/epimerase/oxygenase